MMIMKEQEAMTLSSYPDNYCAGSDVSQRYLGSMESVDTLEFSGGPPVVNCG